MPIPSDGEFIVKHQSVLWQTKSPVYSEILILAQGIYRRLAAQGDYQQLVANAEISAILSTVFTGKVDGEQWQMSDEVSRIEQHYCLSLTPKEQQLKQAFQSVDLCVPTEPSHSKQVSTTAGDDTQKSLAVEPEAASTLMLG